MSIEQENRDETSTAATYLLPSFTESSDFNILPSNISDQSQYAQTDVYNHTDNPHSDNISASSGVTEQNGTVQSQNSPQSIGRTSSVFISTNCTSSATRDDNTTRETSGKLYKRLLKNGFGWWWWEVGASVLSIISIVLMFIFLGRTNGMTLANWNGPVQPNTIVSVLTTIVRTCLMIPIASCLGQYKWKHFRQPAVLESLQTLDEASRGPWGSLTLVLSVKLWRSGTALCLSIVTILALGIEPSAQQILSFPVREALLPNITAHIGSALGWEIPDEKNLTIVDIDHCELILYSQNVGLTLTKPLDHDFSSVEIHLQASVLSAAIGLPPTADFYCPQPATKCSWDDFSTLGVCIDTSPSPSVAISCGNLTVENNYTGRETEYYCNFTIEPFFRESNWSSCDPGDSFLVYPPKPMMVGEGGQIVGHTSWQTCDNSGSLVESLAIVRPRNDLGSSNISSISLSDRLFSKWKWCERTFHNISATPRGIGFDSISEEQLIMFESQYDYCHFSRSSGRTYCCEETLLASVIDDMVGENVYFQTLFLYPFDMVNFTRNIADTFNSLLTANTMRINTNLQMLPGTAHYDEVYIQVRWYWLILPVMETILTGLRLLLGISIKICRNEPLFKNSVLAYLVYGLEGWEKGEINVRSPESVVELEEVLGRQIAQLGRGEDGLLKLRKE